MVRSFPPTAPSDAAARGDGDAGRLVLYGLRVWTDLLLPFAGNVAWFGEEPDVVIRRVGDRRPPEATGPHVLSWNCDAPCHDGRPVVTIAASPGGIVFWYDGIATYVVSADGRRVEVYPAAGAQDGVVGLVLLTHVFVGVLQRLGCPTIHASAVAAGGRAVAFIGPPGRGKSTMAGYFVRQACPLIADDALPVRVGSDRVEAIPSLPLMKVADEAAAHALGLGRDFPGPVANLAKKIVAIGDALDPRLAFASAPTPLAAIYLLERQAPERLEPGAERLRTLDPSEGLAALLESTLYRTLLTPAERAHLFQAYVAVARNVPIRVLTFPSGFEYQERVYRRIRQDLEGL